MKQKYFIIEFGGEKEIDEMEALELDHIQETTNWIENAMESDAEYFNIQINCKIQMLDYVQYGTELDFYAEALVTVEYDTIVTDEMFESQIYSVEDIITSNLSIVSKITTRLVKE